MSISRDARRFAVVGLLFAAVVSVTPAVAQPAAPEKPRKVTTLEGVTEYRLENGLRVLLYPDPSTPKVSVVNTVLVGSRHEGYGEAGMAHLLEHMTFKGTPTHKNLWKAIEDRGASNNAVTSADRTWYYETLTGTDDNLEFAVRLEADRLVNSLIRDEDLATEMTVVRNEFEKNENEPGKVLLSRVLASAYEWHNYGKTTVGNRSDIERMPAEALRAFYRKHYRPDNAVLVVAGKFDPAKALEFVGRHFGPLKNPAVPLDRTRTEEPAQDGERTVTLRRAGTTGSVIAGYHIPAAAHPDFAPLTVLAQVLDTEPRGRLYKTLIAAKKSSGTSVSAWNRHDPGVFLLSAQVDRGQSADEVRQLLLDATEGIGTNKVTDDEVRDARAELTNGWHLTSSHGLAGELSEWAGCGDWRLLFLHRNRLEKVTAEDVNRVAAKYLVRTNRTVGTYTPTADAERARVPETPDLAGMLKDLKDTKVIAAGEAFDPSPENIQKRVRTLTLESGVKAALFPRKTRGETVLLRLTLRYGNEKSLAGQREAAEYLAPMLLRGTRAHDFAALQREVIKLDNADIEANGTAGQLRFTIQCKRPHLTKVVELIGDILRHPTFPAAEFETLKRATVEGCRGQLKEPGALSLTALRRTLHPHPADDLRYNPTLEETVARYEAVTLEQVRKLYTEQVGGTVGELAIVGDFDPDPTVKQIQGVLAGWKTAVPYRRIELRVDTRVTGATVVIETPDKANAVYRAGHVLAMRVADPDYVALRVGDHILGGSNTSRLFERLRQKEGLSYTVESAFSADDLDANGAFSFFAICNPANMPKVRRAMAEEIDRILKDGVTAAEVDAVKKSILPGRRTFTDGQILFSLADDLHTGDSFDSYIERTRQFEAMTAERVNAALRKHLQPKKLVIVEAGDFRNAKAPK